MEARAGLTSLGHAIEGESESESAVGRSETATPVPTVPEESGVYVRPSVRSPIASIPPTAVLAPSLERRLMHLESLTQLPNWDREGAEAIHAARWAEARELLCLQSDDLNPRVSPGIDGTVHVSWTIGDELVCIELCAGSAVLTTLNVKGESDVREFESLSDLRAAAALLLAR
jgi:hypothetical protein